MIARLCLFFALALPLESAVPAQDAQTVDGLVTSGRALLRARKADDALPLFERAAALDGQSVRTRLWILRAWMDQGRSNDTLDAIDALRSSGETGPELDYLYGMAFVRRAEQQIAQGVTDSSIEMNFLDATERLGRATEAAPARFDDGFLALSTASWYTQGLGVARTSGERAVALHPDDARAWFQLGRVALSQFRTAFETLEWNSEAEGHWGIALHAFERAVELLGEPVGRAADQAQLAEAALELGHTRMWKKQREDAARAYATAIAWSPERLDYGLLHRYLELPESDARNALFHRTLEVGAARFARHFGSDDVRDATLLWWLGWARFALGRPAEAERAFVRALEKSPQFVNTWYWVAVSRFDAGDHDGAVRALRDGWEADPAALVTEMQGELVRNVWRLETLLRERVDADDLGACAFLAELAAEAEPAAVRHWNNLGLFLRHEADALVDAAEEGEAEAPNARLLAELHERSFAAYTRALDLAPDDPAVLNDGAVLLHYYLERDWQLALEMYAEADRLVNAALEDESTSDDERARLNTVRMDVRANQTNLRSRIAARERLEETRKKLAKVPPL